ncbi:MAG: Sugar fermentation stimulation protein A [Candidatus Heimdallarchaeota archaeon LC_3]|nr:MAG: Sugar fermentation stimulation protein A [Candidatus Heimdallarchaeota archaeon LC_3]
MSSFYQPDNFSYDFGTFIERPNRFVAYVRYNNKIKRCHIPDPGRLKELLLSGVNVLLRIPRNEKNYKTFAAVIAVQLSADNWVSIDSQLANRFIKHEWKYLPSIKEYDSIKPEFSLYNNSRIDFYLHSTKRSIKPCLVEVKTVTLHSAENSGMGELPTPQGVGFLVH